MNDLSLRARVSLHLSWTEATCTDHREFLEENSNPPPEVRANLVRFAVDLFEPARALLGPLRVNSAYRCPALNTAIGGSITSAHKLGLAADVFPLERGLQDCFERIAQSGIPFDQLIFEFGRWIHLGAAIPGRDPRGQLLMIFSPGHYESWSAIDPRFQRIA